jgi:hypothetical protein
MPFFTTSPKYCCSTVSDVSVLSFFLFSDITSVTWSSFMALPGHLLAYVSRVRVRATVIGMAKMRVRRATMTVKTGSEGGGVRVQDESALVQVHCVAPATMREGEALQVT